VDGLKASERGPAASGWCGLSGWWNRCFYLASWGAVFGMLALALLRILWHDGWRPLTCINAFTTYVYLPAYVVLIFALWNRHLRLAAAAAAVVICHVVWIAPDFAPAAEHSAHSPGEPTRAVRIFFNNASHFNADYSGLIQEIEQVDPDVVAFAEFNSRLQGMLRKATFFQKYRFGTDLHAPFAGEVAVFSRLPAAPPTPRWAAGRPTVVVEIPLGTSSLHVFALHSPRPMKWPIHKYEAFWKDVLPMIAEQTRPLVVVGDFNATQHSWVYEQLMNLGLRSAHVDRGRGYATTWPNGRLPFPPIRIDQALLSPDVECLRIEEGIGAGTDHEPLILDVRVR
jgi:endonuclease/exonuclease/phosphatase (EEP) superfamily protein YafD